MHYTGGSSLFDIQKDNWPNGYNVSKNMTSPSSIAQVNFIPVQMPCQDIPVYTILAKVVTSLSLERIWLANRTNWLDLNPTWVDHMSELMARGVQVDSKSSNMGPTESTPPQQEWRSEDLRHAQIEDPDLRPILTWMESSKARPVWNEVSPHSESTKTYWSQWKSLQLRDGVLYQCRENAVGDSVSWQLIAPRSKRKLIFTQLHSLPTAGHFGVSKTLARI